MSNYAKIIKIFKKNKKLMDKKKNLEEIKKFDINKIDYIEFLDLKTLRKPKNKKCKFNIFLAFYLGKTRLIDNF